MFNLKQLFCSHVNNVEILEEGKIEYTQLPRYEHGEIVYFYVDIVKETCYKCNKTKIKYKKRFNDKLYTL